MKRTYTIVQWLAFLFCLHLANPMAAQDKLWGFSTTGGNDGIGSIYRMNPADNSIQTLFSFKADTVNQGLYPGGNLVAYNNKLYGAAGGGGSNNGGLLFSFDPATGKYTVLYTFDGTHGSTPNGSLTLFQDKLYGLTRLGGAANTGVLFSFDPATNTYSDLLEFAGATGTYPNGGLTVYNNFLYGVTSDGGAFGAGTVFRFDPSAATNNFISISLTAPSTGGNPTGNLAVCNGLLFGQTFAGGAKRVGTIFSCPPDLSSITNRHNFTYLNESSVPEGGRPQGSLVMYKNTLYGLTTGGPDDGGGILYAFTPAADPANDSYVLKVTTGLGSDFQGNSLIVYNDLLYGATYSSSSTNGSTVFSYDPNSTATTVHQLSDIPGSHNAALLVYNNGLWGLLSYGGTAGNGEIFRVDLTTSQYQREISMGIINSGNGTGPTGTPVLAGGSLLGITNTGGMNNQGILFSYNQSTGVFTKLADFDMANTGTQAGNLLVSDSVVYGVTHNGAGKGQGAIFSYDLRKNDGIKKLLDLDANDPAGGYGQQGDIAIVNNKLYLTLLYGGAQGFGGLYEYDIAANTLSAKHSYNYLDGHGYLPTSGVTLGNSNVLYGQTAYGGATNQGVLFSFDPATGTYTEVFNLAVDGGAVASKLIYAGGKLYGEAAGSAPQLFSYDIAGNSFTTLHVFDATTEGAINGRFALSAGKLYGITMNPNRIWQYDMAGNSFSFAQGLDAIGSDFYNTGLLTVSPQPQQISFSDMTVAYGHADFDPGAKASSGLPVTYTVEDPTVATIVNGKLHLLKTGNTLITASQAGNDAFKKATDVQANLTVNKGLVQVIANDTTMVYGKVNPAALSLHYTGFAPGEDSTVLTTPATVTTDATADAHVRSQNYTITPAGAAAVNYDFTYKNGTLTVAPAPITIKADDKQKLLGAPDPVFTATTTGFANAADSATLKSQLVFTVVPTGEGASDIVPSGISSTDYTITYVKGTLTEDRFAFDPVTAKSYGAADFTLSAKALNGATATFSGNNPAVATVTTGGNVHIVGAGTITFTASFPAAGADPATTRTQTITVAPQLLTVRASNQVVYLGDAIPTLTFQYSGFVNNEDSTSLTVQPVAFTTATATSPVGTYSITVSGGVATNYTFNYVPGVLTIANRPLLPQTISFAPIADKTYGDADVALNITSDNPGNPIMLRSSNSRVATITDDNMVHITGAGTVTITASQAGDATHSAAKEVTQTFTVNKATLTITADNKTKLYGAPVPELTLNYSGWVNKETIAVLTTVPVASVAASTTTPTGSYPISISAAAAGNYTFRYVPGVLVITPVQQVISFPALPGKVYGDVDFPAGASSNNNSLPVTYNSSNTAVATVAADGTLHITGAGTAVITASQAGNSNYADASSVSQQLVVRPAPLVITPDDKVKIQGQNNPLFTFSFAGFVQGEDSSKVMLAAPVATTTADNNALPGSYPITASGAVANANYSISYRTGTLKVITDSTKHDDKLNAWCSNPGQLEVNVFAVANQKATVELYSLYGQKLLSQQVYLVNGNNSFHYPVTNVSSGLYVVRVAGQYLLLTQKIRINR